MDLVAVDLMPEMGLYLLSYSGSNRAKRGFEPLTSGLKGHHSADCWSLCLHALLCKGPPRDDEEFSLFGGWVGMPGYLESSNIVRRNFFTGMLASYIEFISHDCL